MKVKFFGVLIILMSLLMPTLSHAKSAPMFFQTGDELFEIKDAPKYQDGFSLGYACQRFGLFGADVWTWDCKLMAINIEEFSAGDISEADQAEFAAKFSLSDRQRSIWNQYGVLMVLVVLIGFGIFKLRSKSSASE